MGTYMGQVQYGQAWLDLYLYICTGVWRATSRRRTPRRAADGRTGGHTGGRRTGGRYTTDGHTCLRYGGREDTEGAPTWRQGRCINITELSWRRPLTWSPLNGKNHQKGTERGLEGAQAQGRIPKNTIFQNQIQDSPFPENFTWVGAVRSNPPRHYLFLDRTFPQWCSTVRTRPDNGTEVKPGKTDTRIRPLPLARS
jgi:hypothetical protein